jgi:hypothetical protein
MLCARAGVYLFSHLPGIIPPPQMKPFQRVPKAKAGFQKASGGCASRELNLRWHKISGPFPASSPLRLRSGKWQSVTDMPGEPTEPVPECSGNSGASILGCAAFSFSPGGLASPPA